MPPGELSQATLGSNKQEPIIVPDIKPESSIMPPNKHEYNTPQQAIKHEPNMLPPRKHSQATLASNKRGQIIRPHIKSEASVMPSSKHEFSTPPQATKPKPSYQPPGELLQAAFIPNMIKDSKVNEIKNRFNYGKINTLHNTMIQTQTHKVQCTTQSHNTQYHEPHTNKTHTQKTPQQHPNNTKVIKKCCNVQSRSIKTQPEAHRVIHPRQKTTAAPPVVDCQIPNT